MNIFRTVSLFAGLSDAELNVIAQQAVTRSYAKNTIIINEGEITNSFYIIQSGQVKVYSSNEEGKEIILNTEGPGDYFGELALLDDYQRSASIMTTEKTQLVILHKPEFTEALNSHPSISANLVRNLAKKVRVLTDNVKSLALLDVYGRIAKVLLDAAIERDGVLIIETKFTQQYIANCIGSSREMVARILKDLSTGGYISYEGKKMIINEKLPTRY